MPAFLHGHLSIKIHAGRNITVPGSGGKGAAGFLSNIVHGTSDGVDPYCSVRVAYVNVAQTKVCTNDPDPQWNMSCDFACSHETVNLEMRVKSAKRKGALGAFSKVKHLSMLAIPASRVRFSHDNRFHFYCSTDTF